MRNLLVLFAAALGSAAVFADDLPRGWYPVGDQGMKRYLLDVGVAHGYSGPGVRVTAQDDVAGSFGGVGQAISAEKYAGKKIRLSAYLKTDGVADGYAGLWLRVDRPDNVIALDNMNDRGVTGTTDWQMYDNVLHVESDATKILFGAILTGSGVMYADEFMLQVVPDSTPTTGPPKAAVEPQNLSF